MCDLVSRKEGTNTSPKRDQYIFLESPSMDKIHSKIVKIYIYFDKIQLTPLRFGLKLAWFKTFQN